MVVMVAITVLLTGVVEEEVEGLLFTISPKLIQVLQLLLGELVTEMVNQALFMSLN
jgi:FlaG/FlaF family flagellin (archaellin)